MIGVACAAQTRGWTGLPSVLAPCLRRRWPAGPPPSARPHAALSRVGQAVALWGLHNGTSQHLPQPSPPMAGALGRWGMRAWTARLACTAPIQGMARPHAGRAGRLGPCPHAPQTRGKRPCARGVRRLPPPACGPEPTRRLVLGWREHGWGATPGAHPGAPGSGGPGPATRLAGRARPRSGPSPAPPPPPRPARRWPTRPPRCPRLSGGRPGLRRLPRSRRARRGGRGPPARPATRSGVPRPPGPGGLARGAGPSCRRDGSAPARGPGAPRPAPRGPPRASWPHRAQASAARPTRGRRLGAAPSWTAGPRRGRWARPDDRAPDACGAPGVAVCSRARSHRSTPRPRDTRQAPTRHTPRREPHAGLSPRLAPCDNAQTPTRPGGSGSSGLLCGAAGLPWSGLPRGAQRRWVPQPYHLASGGGMQPHFRPSTESVTTRHPGHRERMAHPESAHGSRDNGRVT